MITAAILICLAPTASDGDTLACGRSATRVRLFGVNAPEIGSTGAVEARAALQAIVTGGLMCEPRGASYTRIVAVCTNAAGEDVGRLMLNVGHVTEICSYSRNYYRTCP